MSTDLRLNKFLIHLVLFVLTIVVLVWLTAFATLKFMPEQTLQRYQLNSVWLNRYYGHHPSLQLSAYRAGNTRYIHARGVLFREQTPVATTAQKPIGAVLINERQLIASNTQLLLFSEDGKLLKRLEPFKGLKTAITRVGVHYGLPILQTTSGMWRGDPETWQWTPVELFGVSWSDAISVPADLIPGTVKRVTLHQLLTDIVSGRIVQPDIK